MRSTSDLEPIEDKHYEEAIHVHGIVIYPDRYQVTVGATTIDLTRHEMLILVMLARRPGKVFTFREILNHCYEGYHEYSDRSVKTAIHRLRAKLGDARGTIESRYGVGYKLSEGNRSD